jgi:O-antigen/teichoic acid export membrane protein
MGRVSTAGEEGGATSEALGMRLARVAGVRDAGRVLRDFTTSYLPNQALAALAGVIALPILAHELRPTYLGVLAIAQTLISFGWVLVGSWLGSSVIRELPRYRLAGDLGGFRRTLERGLGVTGLALVAFFGAVAIGGVFSSAIRANELLIDLASAGLLLQNIANSLFAGSLRPRLYLVVDAGARVGGIGLGIALVLLGHGVGGYLAGLAAASLGMGIIGLWLGWPRGDGVPAGATPPLAPWVRFGVPAAAAGIATWGLAFADRYILAGLRDASAVGIYSLGNTIGDKAISIPAVAFGTAAGPLLISAWERHGRGEVERLMRSYTRILLLIGVPTVSLLAVTSTTILRLIAPANYRSADSVVAIVAAGSLVYALSLIGYTGLIVAKRTTPMLSAAAIGLVVNVVANFVLIPPFGIVGAAIATPVGMLGFALATQVWSRRLTRWHFPWETLLRTLVAAAVGYGAARAVISEFASPGEALVLACGAFVFSYAGVLAALGERQATLRLTQP